MESIRHKMTEALDEAQVQAAGAVGGDALNQGPTPDTTADETRKADKSIEGDSRTRDDKLVQVGRGQQTTGRL